jgi:hypothetical protein
MPRKMEAGRFGKRTTLPSGCMKNLSRSPGFKPEMLADGLWNCRLPFAGDCGFHGGPFDFDMISPWPAHEDRRLGRRGVPF